MNTQHFKESLRKNLLQKRQMKIDLKPDHIQNNAIYDKTYNLVEAIYDEMIIAYQNSQQMDIYCTLGLYWPILGEPDLLKLAITTKWATALPKISDDYQMDYVRYHLTSEVEPFQNTGIMQPAGNVTTTPKVIIVPALALSINGYRLGFGKGCYDRYINLVKQTTKITTIGVCFHENLLEYLPNEPHDVKLDYIITDQILLKLQQSII